MLIEVNNQIIMSITQKDFDGPINIAWCHEGQVEAEMNISAADFVTMVNWYNSQKHNGNTRLEF